MHVAVERLQVYNVIEEPTARTQVGVEAVGSDPPVLRQPAGTDFGTARGDRPQRTAPRPGRKPGNSCSSWTCPGAGRGTLARI